MTTAPCQETSHWQAADELQAERRTESRLLTLQAITFSFAKPSGRAVHCIQMNVGSLIFARQP